MEKENKIYKKPKRYTIHRSKELINHTSNRIRGTKKKAYNNLQKKGVKIFIWGERERERELQKLRKRCFRERIICRCLHESQGRESD
jgi:hypothetical protein